MFSAIRVIYWTINLLKWLKYIITKTLDSNENKLRILEEKLKILNPDELLEKGYVVKDPDEIRKSKAKNVIIILFLAIVIVLLILLSLK